MTAIAILYYGFELGLAFMRKAFEFWPKALHFSKLSTAYQLSAPSICLTLQRDAKSVPRNYCLH